MVKLLTVTKFHEGVRVEMICGKRVLDYLNMVNTQNRKISVELSAKIGQTSDAVKRLHEEASSLKTRLYRLQEAEIRREAEFYANQGDLLLFK